MTSGQSTMKHLCLNPTARHPWKSHLYNTSAMCRFELKNIHITLKRSVLYPNVIFRLKACATFMHNQQNPTQLQHTIITNRSNYEFLLFFDGLDFFIDKHLIIHTDLKKDICLECRPLLFLTLKY